MEAKIRKFSSLSATVTSLCNNEAANPISHRSLIRFHPPTVSTLIRLPTGTFNLNYNLHKINRAHTPKCQYGFNNETIAHFLHHFLRDRATRRVLHNNITEIAGRSASPLNLDVLLNVLHQLWLSSMNRTRRRVLRYNVTKIAVRTLLFYLINPNALHQLRLSSTRQYSHEQPFDIIRINPTSKFLTCLSS
jgi:hypothetical protein